MSRTGNARRMEALTALLALVVVVVIGGGALAGARALSHRLGAPGQFDPGDPAATAVTRAPANTTTTTPTTTPATLPPTTLGGPSFTTSTVSSLPANSQLQIAGQAVSNGARLDITVAVQLSATGRRLGGQSVTITNNNQCAPGEWLGFTDSVGHASTTFSCAPSGPEVDLTATAGTAKSTLILHR